MLNEVSKDDSESENSGGSLEASPPRYRKRSGSKRNDVSDNNENLDRYRKIRNSPHMSRINSVRDSVTSTILDEKELIHASTTTLKMNNKDIYFGTWNPKERAILDQVLHNIDLKPDKKSFIDKIKRKDTKTRKEKIDEIPQITEEEEENPFLTEYPFCQYKKPLEKQNRNKLLGIFSGLKRLKNNMLNRQGRTDGDNDCVYDDPWQNNSFSRKKKNIFRRFGRKKEVYLPRRRAHSTNENMRSTTLPEPDQRVNIMKKKSGSTNSLKSLFTRPKSDNLNGAFEFFTNETRIFKRTQSIKYINKNQHQNKNGSSNKTVHHGFEVVQLSAKELGYNDAKLVYAEGKVVQPQTASQLNLNARYPYDPHPHHGYQRYYDSAFEDDYRDYQSDRSPSIASANPTFNYKPFSDPECASMQSFRAHSSMSANPGYYTRSSRLGHGPINSFCNGPPLTFYAPPGYVIPSNGTPGYFTPGHITPGNVTPGYVPSGFQSDCTSESDNGNMATAHISMVPYYARKAIERSLSKKSANSNYSSNYSYMSDTSFYDEEIYSMMSPKDESVRLRRNCSKTSRMSTRSTMSTVL